MMRKRWRGREANACRRAPYLARGKNLNSVSLLFEENSLIRE